MELMCLKPKEGTSAFGKLYLYQKSWGMMKGKAGRTRNSSSANHGRLLRGSRLISLGAETDRGTLLLTPDIAFRERPTP